jgi:hypothetical protein
MASWDETKELLQTPAITYLGDEERYGRWAVVAQDDLELNPMMPTRIGAMMALVSMK